MKGLQEYDRETLALSIHWLKSRREIMVTIQNQQSSPKKTLSDLKEVTNNECRRLVLTYDKRLKAVIDNYSFTT